MDQLREAKNRVVVILGVDRKFWREHRVRNQVNALSGSMKVLGYALEGLDTMDGFVKVQPPGKIIYRIFKLIGIITPVIRIRYERKFYCKTASELKALAPDFIIAHNIVDAYIAIDACIPYIFDSHEYLPKQFDGSLLWRLMEVRYRQIALRKTFEAAFLITVEGEKVANAYQNEFPVTRGKMMVLKNAPRYLPEIKVEKSNDTRIIRIIHHGVLVPERGLEIYFKIIKELGPGYELTLMGGGGDKTYIQSLKEMAASAGNIFIKDPVPYNKIVENLIDFDLAFVFFGSPHYHHKYMTVPNKFWESLQARVPVVVSPEGAMAEYTRNNNCGLVPESNTIEGYIDIIRNTTPEAIREMKEALNSLAFNHSVDSWIGTYAETINQKLVNL